MTVPSIKNGNQANFIDKNYGIKSITNSEKIITDNTINLDNIILTDEVKRLKKSGEQKIIDAVKKSDIKLDIKNTELKFYVHDKTNRIAIKIIDTNTKEVIKEIPSEKILDIVARSMEIAGLFLDETK